MWKHLICTIFVAALASAEEGGLFSYPAAGGNYVWNTAQVQRIAWTTTDFGLYTITLGQKYNYVDYYNPIKVIFMNNSLTAGSWTWDWTVDFYGANLDTGNTFILIANNGYAQNFSSELFTLQRSVPGASSATTGLTYATLVSAASPNAATSVGSNSAATGITSNPGSNSGSNSGSNQASSSTNLVALGAGIGGGIGGAILLVGGIFAILHHRRRRRQQRPAKIETSKPAKEPLRPDSPPRSDTPPYSYMMEQDFRDIPSELPSRGRYDPTKTPQEVHATHVVHEMGHTS